MWTRPRRELRWLALVGAATLQLASCRAGSLSFLQAIEGGAGTRDGGVGSTTFVGPDNPNKSDGGQPPDGNSVVAPRLDRFRQGLFRGQDPRLVQRGSSYYYTGYLGDRMTLYKSPTLIDLGVGKDISDRVNFELGSPIFIDRLGGQAVNAWFIFGSTGLYRNAADPYDNAEQWQHVGPMPWADGGSQVPFDFEIFRNPQDGPYKDRWYIIWVKNDPPGGWAENIFISEITSLSATGITLSNTTSSAGNRIAYNRGIGDWADIIMEAPGIAIHDQSVTMVYTGNGASLTLYAMGFAVLRPASDPTQSGSWLDLSHGDCPSFSGSRPQFAKTADVTGPGVGRFVKSADGSEDWMIFHAKIYDTWDPTDPRPEVDVPRNEMWSRYLNIQKIGWQTASCGDDTYTVPQLGQPAAQDADLALPAGDPGPVARTSPFRIEAEAMISFGYVMGASIQSLPTSNTMVLAVECSQCSQHYKVGNLAQLARDVPQSPKRAGLIWRNSAPGSGLTVAHANASRASLDLYLSGRLAQTLELAATGDDNTYKTTTIRTPIALGDEIRLVYEEGKSADCNLDYIEVLPP